MCHAHGQTYLIPLSPLASMQDSSTTLALCPFGTCVLFGHDCTYDSIRLVCIGGRIWLGLEIVRCLVRMMLLMLF